MIRPWIPSVALWVAVTAATSAQSVEEVLDQYFRARGGLEKIKAVQSLRLTGKISLGPGIEAPLVIEQKRDVGIRTEFTYQNLTAVQAYDGKSGWRIMPFGGNKIPQPMSPEEVHGLADQADIDGVLVDAKTKGHTVELIGRESNSGQEMLKLKVSLKSGNPQVFHIDPTSYLTVKVESKRNVQGVEQEFETILGDYRDVEGMKMPFSIENVLKGLTQRQKMVIEKIEVNPPINNSRFKTPAPEKKAVEPRPPKAPLSLFR